MRLARAAIIGRRVSNGSVDMTVGDEEYTNSAARLVKSTNNSKYYQQEATVSEDYRTGSYASGPNGPTIQAQIFV